MFNYDTSICLPVELINNRLRCWCRFYVGNLKSEWFRCFIDTGATQTTIPESFWQPYAKKLGVRAGQEFEFLGAGGASIASKRIRINLEVAGSEDSKSPIIGSRDILDRGIISLGNCEVLLAYDRTAAQKVYPAASLDMVKMKSMQYILLGLDALVCGGVCVNCSKKDAHLIFVQS
jgi:hypothetical protein